MADHLPAEEVRQQMRRALKREVPVRIKFGHETWKSTYAGEVHFMFGDWEIVIFNDCDSFDYVDSATAPDGRHGDYDSWAKETPIDLDDYSNNNPDRGWTEEEFAGIKALLEAAR